MILNSERQYQQDDDLQLSEAEPYRMLAYAMIKRAFRDSIGKTGVEHASRGDKRFLIMADAKDFMQGQGFRHYCELLGCDPDYMLALIDERGGDS